jgi:hypothetical protein
VGFTLGAIARPRDKRNLRQLSRFR